SVWKSGGAASRQRDTTDGQRAANLHPTPVPSCTAADAIAVSTIHVRAALAWGIDDSRSCVYGCRGCWTTSSTSPASATAPRSEERRVGKEWRSRGWADH